MILRAPFTLFTVGLLSLACADSPTQQSDVAPQADVGFADDATEDISASFDCGVTQEEDNAPPVIPPFVAGPPAELFDCTAPSSPPEKQGHVDLNCFLNMECDTRMIVGHRGAGGNLGTIAPENSLQSIRAAIVMGIEAVELDIRHSADDELVLLHDSSVNRTTNHEGVASDFPLAELIEMSLLPPKHSKLEGDFSCARIPTLEEAFELTRDRIVIILDTKTDRIDLVVPAIVKAGMRDQVFISVSDAERAAEARALDPLIRVQIRPDSSEELDVMLELFERPPEIVEIPTDQVAPMREKIRNLNAKVFTDVWVPDAIAYAEGHGAGYLELYDAGAQILQTEYPPQVLKALERWTFDEACPDLSGPQK